MAPKVIDQELADIAQIDSDVHFSSGPGAEQAPVAEAPAAPAESASIAEAPASEAPKESEAIADAPTGDPAPEAKATEPVATEEPKAEPVQVDIAKILSEVSGGKITTTEDLNRILEENTTLSNQIKSSPELSEYTKRIDAWVKKGLEPELFHLVADLPLDEMSADDKVKAHLKIQNPDWSSDDIDLYVKQNYSQLSEDEDGYNPNAVRFGALKLQQDAAKLDAELRKLQEATMYTDSNDKEAERIEGERQTTWKSNLPALASTIAKIPFKLDEKNSFEFSPNATQIQNAVRAVENAVMNAPVNFDENGKNSVKELIKNTIITQNINDIIKAATKQVSSAVQEQKIKEVTNPSGAIKQTPAPVIEKSLDDQNMEKVDNLFFGS